MRRMRATASRRRRVQKTMMGQMRKWLKMRRRHLRTMGMLKTKKATTRGRMMAAVRKGWLKTDSAAEWHCFLWAPIA